MSQEPSLCAFCGAPLSTTARFCESCGQPVQSTGQAGKIPPPIYKEEQPLEPPEPKAVEPLPGYAPPSPPPAPGKKSRLALPLVLGIVVACLCCLVAAVLVAGAWLFFKPVQQSGPVEIPGIEATVEIFKSTLVVPLITSLPEIPPSMLKPAATEEEQPAQVPNVNFDGVSFYLDPRIASGITGEVIPAAGTVEDAYFQIYPEYVQIQFAGYSLDDTFHEAQVNIYPVEEYAGLNEVARDQIDQLRQVLATGTAPGPDEDLPFLPIWGAAQIMQAKVEFIDFQNGSGIRYLTQYGQDIYPINNRNMFYTFQGLTEDGAYYVAAIFPASHPLLQDAEELARAPDWGNTFEAYIKTTELMLDAEVPGNFIPDLRVLDELIESIEVVK